MILAIKFLPALGFTIGGILLGFYGAYRLFAWALREEDDEEYAPPVPIKKLNLDYFEERLS